MEQPMTDEMLKLADRLVQEPLSYHKFSPAELDLLLKALRDYGKEHRRYLDASRRADDYRKERDIWRAAAFAESELGKQAAASRSPQVTETPHE
jgi:hypothetical protein